MGSRTALAVYTYGHFVIDFSCLYLAMGRFAQLSGSGRAAGFLIYNFTAFAMQAVIGYLFDRFSARAVSGIGCMLVICGIAVSPTPLIWPALLLCAAGNAFYHVGGGIDALGGSGGQTHEQNIARKTDSRTDYKMTRCGIFVSSGALGVSLGTYAGSHESLSYAAVLLLLTSVLLGIYFCCRSSTVKTAVKAETQPARPAALLILCCLSAVLLRSYGGIFLPAIKGSLPFYLTASLAVIGKASGGIMADRFGPRRIGIMSQLTAAVLFLFCRDTAILLAAGIILFHMTMPVTLYTIYHYLGGSPGFALGLTTLFLFLGSLLPRGPILPGNDPVLFLSFLLILSALLLALSVPRSFHTAGRPGRIRKKKTLPILSNSLKWRRR